jgi:hypothetical protein
MDLLSAVFLGCFVFGFVAALASFLLGGVHGLQLGGHHLDLGASHPHVGHLGGHGGVSVGHAADAGHVGGHGETDSMLPINPTTVLTFLTWFGGAGFIFRNFYGAVAAVSLVGAGIVGIIGAGLVFVFLLKVIMPHQAEMRQEDYDPVGSVGRVTVAIRDGGVGEVVYTRGGTRRSAGARSTDGHALQRGTEVVIANYDRGVAYVEPWTKFVSSERRRAAAEGND